MPFCIVFNTSQLPFSRPSELFHHEIKIIKDCFMYKVASTIWNKVTFSHNMSREMMTMPALEYILSCENMS